jgi:hypothetical protein
LDAADHFVDCNGLCVEDGSLSFLSLVNRHSSGFRRSAMIEQTEAAALQACAHLQGEQ